MKTLKEFEFQEEVIFDIFPSEIYFFTSVVMS